MTPEQISEKLEIAKKIFLDLHHMLLEVGANERSITHKFAECMTALFEGWNVDCEYNRDLYEPKRIVKNINEVVRIDDDNAVSAFPDIIVHHRGGSGAENNLLVIEAKKDSSKAAVEDDCEKLRRIKNSLNYQFTAFINFKTGERCGIDIRELNE